MDPRELLVQLATGGLSPAQRAEVSPAQRSQLEVLAVDALEKLDWAEAATVLRALTVLDADRPAYWLELGRAADRAGDGPTALAALDRYLGLDAARQVVDLAAALNLRAKLLDNTRPDLAAEDRAAAMDLLRFEQEQPGGRTDSSG